MEGKNSESKSMSGKWNKKKNKRKEGIGGK